MLRTAARANAPRSCWGRESFMSITFSAAPTYRLAWVLPLRKRDERALRAAGSVQFRDGVIVCKWGFSRCEPLASGFTHGVLWNRFWAPRMDLSRSATCPGALREIGRAHVCTPVTIAPLVCRLLPENKKQL